ncbi:hypothetical protein BbiDN127_I0005 (plasmid) [Borreliella bissettiae DN127]|uniref:Uncharacterized protein n=1 Tax=Borrelia bissettiae (strain DSM 17990 / CIP 109136 / DN127) TaxID=521010 RepID=G0AP64_BORBD|nr:hypothetical protein [Borreliella bissettiae]AEL19490.1 hypothetical protein BbiDN127_I0005 [Borreliella bissettiae DN127]
MGLGSKKSKELINLFGKIKDDVNFLNYYIYWIEIILMIGQY